MSWYYFHWTPWFVHMRPSFIGIVQVEIVLNQMTLVDLAKCLMFWLIDKCWQYPESHMHSHLEVLILWKRMTHKH